MHIAARKGYLDIACYLTDKAGADINATSRFGCTALYFACCEGNLSIVEHLLACGGIDVEARHDNGWTAIFFAAQYGYRDIVQCIFEHSRFSNKAAVDGTSLLQVASTCGHLEIVKYLLSEKKAYLEESSFEESSSDDSSSDSDDSSSDESTVEEASVKVSSGRIASAFHCACLHGHLHIVKHFMSTDSMTLLRPLHTRINAMHFILLVPVDI